jgi:UDPglucose 6-dehydrogenase
VREVAPLLSPTAVVVTKSTVPVGTGDEIERILRPEADMHVVSNPEFLREGAAIYDFKHPDRIVIGSDNEAARAVMAEVYRPLYLNAAPLLHVSRRTAELINTRPTLSSPPRSPSSTRSPICASAPAQT